jgi:hypothetical protein
MVPRLLAEEESFLIFSVVQQQLHDGAHFLHNSSHRSTEVLESFFLTASVCVFSEKKYLQVGHKPRQ